jgi:serine/threonine protein kinase
MTEEGRMVAGRYRLLSRIGTGAMGVVWRAWDERLNRTVAVKKLLLPPGLPDDEAAEAVARCLREGRIAARLHHPNAISVYDVVDEDGVPCLIMEYLPSKSLAMVLGELGALDAREVARIGAESAAALVVAHAAGIVHRDVKPGNILLGDDGSVKITDFGISRATDDVTVTKTGMIAGTPAYLAPEVAIGRDPTPASDVFSLGSTLYAAVEGEPPFGLSENTLGLLHRVAAGKINPPLSSGPLTDVLLWMLAADPEQRPTTTKVRDMLYAVGRGDEPSIDPIRAVPAVAPPLDEPTRFVSEPTALVRPAQTRPPMRPVAPPPPETDRSRQILLVLAVALLITLVAAGGWMLANKTRNNETNPDNGGNPNSQVVVPATSTTSDTPPPTTTTTTKSTTSRPTSSRTTTTTTTTTTRPTTTTPTTTTPTTTTTVPPSSAPAR